MNKIYAEANCVSSGGAKNVIAKLIFLLVANDGECGNFSGELIVAERFESGSGVKICAERKGQREAEIGVAILDVMKIADFESERGGPRG